MKKLDIAIAVIVVIGLVFAARLLLIPGPMAFASGSMVALADYAGGNPTGVPKELAHAALIKRGEYLIHAADCVACHTAAGGQAYAGGFAFVLPGIGTIYSTNITPDKQTGIGNYTDQQFLDVMHKGIRRDGQFLYPAFLIGSSKSTQHYAFLRSVIHPIIPFSLHKRGQSPTVDPHALCIV